MIKNNFVTLLEKVPITDFKILVDPEEESNIVIPLEIVIKIFNVLSRKKLERLYLEFDSSNFGENNLNVEEEELK